MLSTILQRQRPLLNGASLPRVQINLDSKLSSAWIMIIDMARNGRLPPKSVGRVIYIYDSIEEPKNIDSSVNMFATGQSLQ